MAPEEVYRPATSIHRLKSTQNSAARLISRTPRYEHITPVLVQLHWLPITKRCLFKILTITYKASHHNAPPDVCDMLNCYQAARSFRSASTTSLVPNRNRTIRYGRHNHDMQINAGNGEIIYKLVSFLGVHIWNHISKKIPIDVSYACFKNLAKCYLKNNDILYIIQ